jgi:hypothetical protein
MVTATVSGYCHVIKAYLKAICFAASLVSFLCPPSFTASGDVVRIALIADRVAELDESPLVSLLEVELSQTEGLRLLERTEIERILAEQQLSVAGLPDRHAAIKVGWLLRADAFLLLSAEDGAAQGKDKNGLLRARFVETAHGLRLWDSFEPLNAAKFAEIAQKVTNKVSAARDKLTLPAGQAIPVGIVDVHRVQLGDSHRWLTRVIPGMLSVRLSKEPRIVMLERADLQILRRETLLTEG